jgi:hypothetical protein
VEVRNLLSLCRELVERKSVRVLDGCVSLVLSRYRNYMEQRRPGGALHWLLVGIEMESLVCLGPDGNLDNWQNIEAVSVCYRHLVTWCTSVAGSLLRGMLEEREGLGLVYATAKAMVDAVKEGPLEAYAAQLPEVRTLELVLAMYDGMADGKDWSMVARNITICLQEEANMNDGGVVASLAPRSMHWDLLQLGYKILETGCPSFDVKGVQVLLEQLTVITTSREVEGLKPLPPSQIDKMKLALGKGLMRAFVSENAKRKPDGSAGVDDTDVSKIKAMDLHKYSRDKQERVVSLMLDI